MAPLAERPIKESSWVRKAGAKERNGDSGGGEDGDEERTRGERRDGRGRGRQVRDGRGARRDIREGTVAVGLEDGSIVEGKGTRGRGRGQKGGRKGPESGQVEEIEFLSGEDVGDDPSISATLNLLKGNSLKITRYSKGDLLSIARLPASNLKPPELDPLIDKTNKESQLVTRALHVEDVEGAREKRRERRNERRNVERVDGSGGEEELVEREAAAAPAAASSPLLPKSRAQPPAVPGPLPVGATSTEKLSVSKPTVPSAEGDGDHATARIFDKIDRKKFEQAVPTAGDAQPAPSQEYLASLLQQQAAAGQQSLNQSQILQAYLQVMSMNAAAARTGYPTGLPWGYNPYLFGYGDPGVAGAYPGSAGALVGANALGASGGYGNMATEGRREGGTPAVAAAKAAAGYPSRPSQPRGGSAVASLPATKKPAPVPLEAGSETSFLLPAVDVDSKNDDDDEAGCSQQ